MVRNESAASQQREGRMHRCPACQSERVRRSKRRGFVERVPLTLLLLKPRLTLCRNGTRGGIGVVWLLLGDFSGHEACGPLRDDPNYSVLGGDVA